MDLKDARFASRLTARRFSIYNRCTYNLSLLRVLSVSVVNFLLPTPADGRAMSFVAFLLVGCGRRWRLGSMFHHFPRLGRRVSSSFSCNSRR